MKTNFVLICLTSLILNVGSVTAGITPLNEYEWKDKTIGDSTEVSGYSEGIPASDTSENISADSCPNQCPGYSPDIGSCPAGSELSSCSGCAGWYKCVESECAPGYDKNYKECNIDVQEDNYLCSKCID